MVQALQRRRTRGPGWILVLSAVLLLGACGHSRPAHRQTHPAPPTDDARVLSSETGIASWYGEPYHGRRTASGEVYNMYDLTAAHRTLEFGTWVRVTRDDTGADVEVRINDRGPFIHGRIIDLSYAAAQRIGLEIDGVAPVRVDILSKRRKNTGTVPALPPVRSGSDCFWVQVGAFGDVSNAVRAVDRLKDGGEKALMMEGPGGLQRVRVGPYDERDPAEAARLRLLPEWPAASVVECGG